MRCMMHGFNLLVPVMALAACVAALGQTQTYNLGRTPREEEIRAWDISIGPEGKELPPGSGSAKEGAPLFAQKCAVCHGPTGKGSGPGGSRRLVGGQGTLTTTHPVKTLGSSWPVATTVWDYVNRAMPQYEEDLPHAWVPVVPNRPSKREPLSADEVYALTALLLYWNDIIKEDDILDAETLPKITMPNRDGFVPKEPKWKKGEALPFGQYP